MPERPLILVIEDEYLLQADVEKILTEAGFATDILSSGEEALTLLMGGLKRPSALVTDVSLAGRLSGWEVARRIREKDPSFPVIYVTAYGLDWASHGFPTASSSRSHSLQLSLSLPFPSFSMRAVRRQPSSRP